MTLLGFGLVCRGRRILLKHSQYGFQVVANAPWGQANRGDSPCAGPATQRRRANPQRRRDFTRRVETVVRVVHASDVNGHSRTNQNSTFAGEDVGL